MKEWLKNKITFQEAEAKHLIIDERLGAEPIAFGFINNQWEELKSIYQEGDELWEFYSPGKAWDKLMGRAGYCLIRDGEIIADIVTEMS